MDDPIRLGVLLSGSGRTLQNFLDLSRAGRLKARVVKVVSSLSSAYGLERARTHGVPAAVVRRKDYDTLEGFSDAITAELDEAGVELVAMAGFMCLYRIPERYAGRMMNIHPALLPAFGGQGFYGERVHQAVLDYGCKVSGCTVHFGGLVGFSRSGTGGRRRASSGTAGDCDVCRPNPIDHRCAGRDDGRHGWPGVYSRDR